MCSLRGVYLCKLFSLPSGEAFGWAQKLLLFYEEDIKMIYEDRLFSYVELLLAYLILRFSITSLSAVGLPNDMQIGSGTSATFLASMTPTILQPIWFLEKY